MLIEMGVPNKLRLNCDSASALDSISAQFTSRNRHVGVRVATLRSYICDDDQVDAGYKHSQEMLADICTKNLKSETLFNLMSSINMCGVETVPRRNTERAQLTRTRRRAAMNTTWADPDSEMADSMDEVTSRMIRLRFGGVASRIVDDSRGVDGSGERGPGSDNVVARAFSLMDETVVKAMASVISQTITAVMQQQQQPSCPLVCPLVCPPCEPTLTTTYETSIPTIVATIATTLGLQHVAQKVQKCCRRRRQVRQVGPAEPSVPERTGPDSQVRRGAVWVADAEVQSQCTYNNDRFQYLGSRASYNTFGANLRRRVDSTR